MNYTTNYHLNQWAKSDQVRMEDFNADNAKIDAAIKAVDQRVDGALQYATGSYTGTNTVGHTAPNSITFPLKPLLVFLSGNYGTACLVSGTTQTEVFLRTHTIFWAVNWNGNSLSWYVTSSNHMGGGTYSLNPDSQMNELGKIYHYVAIGLK